MDWACFGACLMPWALCRVPRVVPEQFLRRGRAHCLAGVGLPPLSANTVSVGAVFGLQQC